MWQRYRPEERVVTPRAADMVNTRWLGQAGTGAFMRQLAERQSDPSGRVWIFVPEDQLSAQIGPLSRQDPCRSGIVLVESHWKAARRPYHKQKLAFTLCNLRHFALEQAARGVAVRYIQTAEPYGTALGPLISELGPLSVMEPAERELRLDIEPLARSGALHVVPHEGWLTVRKQFLRGVGARPPWRMDSFYRLVRRETGILMNGSKPVGGKFSFDVANRRSWKGNPPAPIPPVFASEPIKAEVEELIHTHFSHHPGHLDLETIPAAESEARALWDWAKVSCLPHFGPYEDAMSLESNNLFHTRISALLNIHRLLPAHVVGDVQALDVPLACKEGFIRQVLGWREFVRHVHVATDGFRQLPGRKPTIEGEPGDGGYAQWAGRPWPAPVQHEGWDGTAMPSYLGAHRKLPPAFWGTSSGLKCLDTVVADVWNEGYSHHITRLMVLANLATLLDTSPRELTDWFWIAYTDAYDWVVEPNVLGMGTYATADLMTTKPYVSGAAYIAKMSNYCGSCNFDPVKSCPITRLYWAFLARHQGSLSENPRLRLPLAALRRRSAKQRQGDAKVFGKVGATLEAGKVVTPSLMNEVGGT